MMVYYIILYYPKRSRAAIPPPRLPFNVLPSVFSNLIFRQTRRHETNILSLGASLRLPHGSSCIMHHASSSSSSCTLLSLCGDEMGSWIAGFAPEGGTQHDAEITLRVGDASVGRTQFSIGKLSKFQTKMTPKSIKSMQKFVFEALKSQNFVLTGCQRHLHE